jgi:hypothetical protein
VRRTATVQKHATPAAERAPNRRYALLLGRADGPFSNQFAYFKSDHHLVEHGPEVIADGAFTRWCERLPSWPPEKGSGPLDAGEV